MASHIRLLEDDVINKIAAGEVIERPASVLKELVENALDASAQSIRIELEDGGKKRLAVTDDGCGMSPQDCLMAVKRHATSKIRQADDLFAISTLGFRGEALASIAAVSRFSLMSKARGEDEGSKLETEGGEHWQQSPWHGNDFTYQGGSHISVNEIFFNVPARSKFLKAYASEYAACLELVESLALSHPHVSFNLIHNGKNTFSAPKVVEQAPPEGAPFGEKTLRLRVSQILPKETAQALLYTCEENQYGRYEALVSPPGMDKASAKSILSFVNKRWVKDKTIQYGVLRGYHSHLLKGRYPQVVGFFTCDPALVDVNAHPSKFELRFQYGSEVQGLLSLAVRRALRTTEWALPTQGFSQQPPQPEREPAIEPVSVRSQSWTSPSSSGFSHYTPQERIPTRKTLSFGHDSVAPKRAEVFAPSTILFGQEKIKEQQPHIQTPIDWAQLNYIGSFAQCYLLFEWDGNGGKEDKRLLAVDQHAFHERILYERYSAPSAFNERQTLLIPEEIVLDKGSAAALQEVDLAPYGFVVHSCSEHSIEVTAVPVLLRGRDLQKFFQDISQQLSEGMALAPEGFTHHILATLACHSAVRAGEYLGANELQALLREADSVDFFHNCPHGRRVFKWFERGQVEAWFDRI